MAAKKKTTTTKAIASSAGAGAASTPQAKDESLPVMRTLYEGLTPKEAFQSNIHVRKAILGIADQIAKMRLRIFSRSTGDEIVGGPLYDLLRRPYRYGSTHSLIHSTVCWHKIAGEFAVWPITDRPVTKPVVVRPNKLLILDPTALYATPLNCRSFEGLEGWVYRDGLTVGQASGAQFEIPADGLIFAKDFSAVNGMRGSSLSTAGNNEISTNFYAGQHNASFFKHGTSTDIIVRFPKGTDPKVAKEWVERWHLAHSVKLGGGFNVSALIGEDMQIETPGVTARDGQFLELANMTAENIGGLYGVPPSVMGFLSKTRFDTIDVELEGFAENTLLPESEQWSQTFQTQLVDRYFPSAKQTKKADAVLTKRAKAAFERVADTHVESDVVIMLDPDSLPIMSKINASKLIKVGEVCDKLFLSRAEGADYFGVELPPNPVRDQVWVPSGYTNASAPPEPKQPLADAKVAEEVKALRDELSALRDVRKPLAADAKALADRLAKFYRAYRSLALDGLDTAGRYDKRAVFALANEHDVPEALVKLAVHRDYLDVAKLAKAHGDDKAALLRAVKDHFNMQSKPAALKALAASFKGDDTDV